MNKLVDFPVFIMVIAFLLQFAAAYAGDGLARRMTRPKKIANSDFETILPAALTLLAIIVGFAFSMAVSRYDLRKTYEEEEANAIGTEYLRVDILPSAKAANIHDMLAKYTALRVRFYTLRDASQLDKNAVSTAVLQNALWASAIGPVTAQPTQPMALVMSGMNDVLNTQGYTQAEFLNRVPVGAWLLMVFVAMVCNFLLGYTKERNTRLRLTMLPLILAIPFFLIADIDSPHGGLIHVVPQNLVLLQHSLPPR